MKYPLGVQSFESIHHDGYFYIDKTAEEALQQIDDKQYVKPFEHDGHHIYKIGVNFSTKTRRIDGWRIAE